MNWAASLSFLAERSSEKLYRMTFIGRREEGQEFILGKKVG